MTSGSVHGGKRINSGWKRKISLRKRIFEVSLDPRMRIRGSVPLMASQLVYYMVGSASGQDKANPAV